jgi:hypothetical protein
MDPIAAKVATPRALIRATVSVFVRGIARLGWGVDIHLLKRYDEISNGKSGL